MCASLSQHSCPSVMCLELSPKPNMEVQTTVCECCLFCIYTLFTPPLPSPAHSCLRASPSQDHTNGFFVALFERSRKGNSLETVEKQVLFTAPSHREMLTSCGHIPSSHGETHPLPQETHPSLQEAHSSHGDMSPSNVDPPPMQEGTASRPCGHGSAPVLQQLGGGTCHRHCKRTRHQIQLVLRRRLSRRHVVHCRKLFHPSYVLYPKHRCYY